MPLKRRFEDSQEFLEDDGDLDSSYPSFLRHTQTKVKHNWITRFGFCPVEGHYRADGRVFKAKCLFCADFGSEVVPKRYNVLSSKARNGIHQSNVFTHLNFCHPAKWKEFKQIAYDYASRKAFFKEESYQNVTDATIGTKKRKSESGAASRPDDARFAHEHDAWMSALRHPNTVDHSDTGGGGLDFSASRSLVGPPPTNPQDAFETQQQHLQSAPQMLEGDAYVDDHQHQNARSAALQLNPTHQQQQYYPPQSVMPGRSDLANTHIHVHDIHQMGVTPIPRQIQSHVYSNLSTQPNGMLHPHQSASLANASLQGLDFPTDTSTRLPTTTQPFLSSFLEASVASRTSMSATASTTHTASTLAKPDVQEVVFPVVDQEVI